MTKSKSLPVFISLSLLIGALVITVAFHTNSPNDVKAASAASAAALDSVAADRSALSDKNNSAEELIGYRHKGVTRGERLSNGAKDLGGGLLSDEDYGVSRFSKGKRFMLWLEKIVDRDEQGVPDWEVKDVLAFAPLRKKQLFLYSYGSPCTVNGDEDLDLIVMAEENPKKRVYKILEAWRVNIETEKFEAFPIDEIACEYAKN